MNTASRMESTGQAGRIQISQDSAAILIAVGRGSWLTKREDLVSVKGKVSTELGCGDILSVMHLLTICSNLLTPRDRDR